jgi:hypothetical protein
LTQELTILIVDVLAAVTALQGVAIALQAVELTALGASTVLARDVADFDRRP